MAGQGHVQQAAPDGRHLRSLLKAYQPTSVLNALQENKEKFAWADRSILHASALIDLDRFREAYAILDENLDRYPGSLRWEALCLWSKILLRLGRIDDAVLTAWQVTHESQELELQAVSHALAAAGYARKFCWSSAEDALRQALDLAPTDSRILAVQARVRLDADQRIAARSIYERLRYQPDVWGKVIGAWGESYISYLVGEFDHAWAIGQEGLKLSDEAILPLYVLTQICLARKDLTQAELCLDKINQRSPQANGLPDLVQEVDLLRNRLNHSDHARRLAAFPTLVQRRDYCGPSTIELVLRYWKDSPIIDNDQIAGWVKLPQSGSPMYKMRQFFQHLGYESRRTFFPEEKLKQLIDLGIPVIIQEQYSSNSHVAVVIGYDDDTRQFEIQDPMTHTIQAISYDELKPLRELFLESGLVAYPRGRGLQARLESIDVYDHSALVWMDQAVMEMDQGSYHEAISLLERSVQRIPAHAFSWVLLLYAWLELWKEAIFRGTQTHQQVWSEGSIDNELEAVEVRQLFYACLRQAKVALTDLTSIYPVEAQANMLEGRYIRALRAFQKAIKADHQNPRLHASQAECFFALREPIKSFEAARRCLEIDPANPAGNLWMARCLTSLDRENALYFAQAAVELAQDWWLAHIALAEALIQQAEYEQAYLALQHARTLNPAEPEIKILSVQLACLQGEISQALSSMTSLARNVRSVSPASQYKILKMMCQAAFDQQDFEKAVEYAHSLLRSFPQDAWGLQFLASTVCESFLEAGNQIGNEQLQDIQSLFEQAIQLNQGEPALVESYTNYMQVFLGSAASLEILSGLAEQYPGEVGPYLLLQARIYTSVGSSLEAAQVMLQAITRPKAIRTRERLEDALRIILDGLGVEAAARSILEELAVEVTWQDVPVDEIKRGLGLALAFRGNSLLARPLLEQALIRDPQDAEVLLGLGDLDGGEEEREAHYRRTIFLHPDWLPAREKLVDFLLDHGRNEEVIDLTSGYQQSSPGLALAQARALFATGLYEKSSLIFEDVLKRDPGIRPEILQELWQAEIKAGRPSKAYQVTKNALRIEGRSVVWLLRSAISLAESGKFERAESTFQKAAALGLPASDQLQYAYRVALLQQNYPQALAILRELEVLSSQVKVRENLNWFEQESLKVLAFIGDAQAVLETLQEKELDSPGWEDAAQAVFNGGQPELAAQFAQKAIVLDQQNFIARLVFAKAMYELGYLEESFKIFQQLRLLNPQDHTAYEYLALQSLLETRLNEAYELAERSVHLGAECAQAWAVRGLVNFLLARHDDALSDLEIAWNRMGEWERNKKPIHWAVFELLRGESMSAQAWWRSVPGNRGDASLVSQLNFAFQSQDLD